MVFSSTTFLFLFLPFLLAAYHLPDIAARLAGRHGVKPFRTSCHSFGVEYKNTVLLLASLFFYAWGEPRFVFIMAAEIVANWLLGLLIATSTGRRRRAFLLAAVALDIGVLFVFKYLGFLHRTWIAATGSSTKAIEIALPIGISFFTFQILSYVIDLYHGSVAVQRRPDRLALYVALFPQLVAGPIVRYADVEESLRNRLETFAQFSEGVRRFIMGLGKKVLLANYLAVIADNLFLLAGDGRDLSAAAAWIGLLAYTLQIYFDFSGYSDMAIGLGRMFGFRFNENFDHPYAATSVTDFWRRWHMSLSSWFRDYVYIPLGGNRRSPPRVVFNLFVVWLLTGIWHGANWTFIAWGLAYFAALMAERVLGIAKSRNPLMRVWTMLVVMLCWTLFRASSLPDAARYISLLFGAGNAVFDPMAMTYLRNGGTILLSGAILSLPMARVWRHISDCSWIPFFLRETIASFALCAVFLAALLECLKAGHNPFIYFNF